MHAVEDLFAHSNFVEIAVENLLNNELSGMFSDLRDQATGKIEVQTFSPEVTVKGKSNAATGSGNTSGPTAAPQKRKALATGSFSSLDTLESVGHEMTHMLRQPPQAPKSLEEVKALNGLMSQMGEQADKILSDKSNQIKLKESIGDNQGFFISKLGEYGGIEGFINIQNGILEFFYPVFKKEIQALSYQISLLVYNNAMLPMADQMEAAVLETNVGDTSMIKVLESNKETIENEGAYGDAAEMAIDQAMKFDDSDKTEAEIAKLKADRVADATASKNMLEATPEQAIAGPSHSQISKDHKNSVFFGLAFQLAVEADKMIKNKMLDVWKGQKKADIPYGKKEGEFDNSKEYCYGSSYRQRRLCQSHH